MASLLRRGANRVDSPGCALISGCSHHVTGQRSTRRGMVYRLLAMTRAVEPGYLSPAIGSARPPRQRANSASTRAR